MLDHENVLDFKVEMRDTPVLDEGKGKLQRLVQPGQQFIHTYDYGDGWRHTVNVEAIESRVEPMYSATILDGKCAGPPDDVGGPGGYAAFLDTISKRRNTDEAIEYIEWVGDDFDPAAFDRRIANNAFARMTWNSWGKK